MLASTVQFSNNNQPPITPPQRRVHWDRTEEYRPHGRTFRHPTACPTPDPDPHRFPHRSSTHEEARRPVPSSQRSTHEQPLAGHAPA